LGKHVFRRPAFQSIFGEEGVDTADGGCRDWPFGQSLDSIVRRCGIMKDEKDLQGQWKNWLKSQMHTMI
jgi:hypothetical protein